MPPAIIAVAAAVGAALAPLAAATILGVTVAAAMTTIAGIVIASLITVAIAVAAQVAISLTQGRKPSGGRTNQGEELKLKLDPGMPRQLALGRCATGGSIVWSFTYGSTADIPNNAYLVRIIALSDLPINALVGIYEGKTQLAFTGDPTTTLAQCTTHTYDDGTPCMWVRVYKGTPNPTADANLVSWSGGTWTTSHKGTNMAYAIIRYLYDGSGNAFPNGEPQLIFVMDGVKCYDQRFDSTRGAGHSGTQRLTDSSTWAFTRNAAVLAQQVLRGFYSKGVLLLGAQAVDSDLDDAMLVSAYNTCDESVSYSGGTQSRYRAGYMASCSSSVGDILMQLQAAMDGRIIDRGGGITIRPGATHTPVFNLTDDDIIWDMEKSWQPRFNLSEIYNFVDGVFVDEQTIFQEKPFPTLRNTQWELDDGGQRLEYQVAYSAATDWAQVQRMTKRIHVQSRLQGSVAFFLPVWALEMEQDDWFTLSSNRWGFTNKYFQAIKTDLVVQPALAMAVVGQEMDPTIDGWSPAVDEKPRTDTLWTSPTGPSGMPVPVLTVFPVVTTNAANVVQQYGIGVTISNIGTRSIIGEQVEVQYALTSNLNAPSTLGTYQAINQTVDKYGLDPGTSYSVRARTISTRKIGTWSSWVSVTAGLSTLGYSISAQQTIVLQAYTDGALNPTSQLPKTIGISVVKNGTNIATSNSVSFAITPISCAATVDNTNGSATKGVITLTSVTGWTAAINVTVTANGIVLPTIVIVITKSTSAITGSIDSTGGGTSGGGGGGTGGGTGDTASTSTLNNITGSSYIPLCANLTVTLASGQQLYGSGTVGYNDASGHIGRQLTAKWQYSPAGANTWTDFPGSPIVGFATVWDAETQTEYDGSIDLNQQKSGLAAGDYDCRVVAFLSTGSSGTVSCWGTLRITANP